MLPKTIMSQGGLTSITNAHMIKLFDVFLYYTPFRCNYKITEAKLEPSTDSGFPGFTSNYTVILKMVEETDPDLLVEKISDSGKIISFKLGERIKSGFAHIYFDTAVNSNDGKLLRVFLSVWDPFPSKFASKLPGEFSEF